MEDRSNVSQLDVYFPTFFKAKSGLLRKLIFANQNLPNIYLCRGKSIRWRNYLRHNAILNSVVKRIFIGANPCGTMNDEYPNL